MKSHPALKGIDLSNTGRPERAPLMVTKTPLFSADGHGLFNADADSASFLIATQDGA